MSVDWASRPWWHRPVAAIVVGISVGLGFTWLISGLPFPESMWAVLALCAVGMAFCIWQLIDTQRMIRRFEAQTAEWKRQAGADWPE